MSWHFPFVLVVTVTLPSMCLQFSPQPLEELGSDIGIRVFSQIARSRPQENVVVSPHGIASVLGMLQLGADGRTRAQLTAVMRYGVKGACVTSGLWLRGLEGVLHQWVPCWVFGKSPKASGAARWVFPGTIQGLGQSAFKPRGGAAGR